MESNLLSFVWRHSQRQQLFILACTAATLPLIYVSLELPKIIINEAIQGEGFPRVYFGEALDRIEFLLALCGLFLLTVVAINGLKWILNVAVGMCGERMLRRLRFTLFERALRFTPSRVETTNPGRMVQTILGESEPLGGFIGELISTPALQGGMLAVYVSFIFVQDLMLGAAAIAFLPVQMLIIPRLQRRIVRLNRERAATQRLAADAISEPMIGFDDLVVNGASRWRLARLSGLLHANTMIRQAIYRRKFTIKLLANFLNQLTPFLFYSIGGWLVIMGRLDFGALVAVLAAYKDIAKPWRELLNYYQRLSDFRSRFATIAAAFDGDDVLGPERVRTAAADAAPLGGALVFEDVEGGPGAGGFAASALELPPGRHVAVLGGPDGARSGMLRLAAGLTAPRSGRVTLGGRMLATAPLAEIGAAIGYVGPEAALVRGSIRENLLYGLYRRPPRLDRGDMLAEARRTGGPEDDPEGDWIDYAAAGVADAEALEARLHALAEAAGLGPELVDAAMETRLDAGEAARWAEPLSAARDRLADALRAADLADAVAPWDRTAFNHDATLAENILFSPPAADADAAAATLARIGGDALLAEAGWALSREFASVVETVGRESGVLESLGGYGRGEVLSGTDLYETNKDRGLRRASPQTRKALIDLAGRFTPARDRFEIVDDAMIDRILALRARALAAAPPGRAFDAGAVTPGLTIAEAMLGGPRRHARRAAWRRLDTLMREALAQAGLTDALIGLGLGAPAAQGMTPHMLRRIGLIRALLKRPAVVILNGPGAGDGEADRALRALARREAPEATLLRLADPGAAADADMVVRLGEQGQVAGVEGGRESAA